MDGHKPERLVETDDSHAQLASSFVDKILSLSDAWVDRESFLSTELRVRFLDAQVRNAVASSPAKAGIPIEIVDEIADSVIKSHVGLATATSFAAGWPGGFAMAITVPADIVQFHRHQIILVQKLAYLYGWPDLRGNAEFDQETKSKIILLLGSMYGVKEANQALNHLSRRFSQAVVTKVPKQTLTKTFYYNALKKTLKWIGISLNKESFASFLAKLVPVASGATSAGLTNFVFRRAAKKLQRRLRELEFAQPGRNQIRIEVDP